MKLLMAMSVLMAMCWVSGQEKPAITQAVKLTQTAVAMLGDELEVQFSIPFPTELDIDRHLIQPLGRLNTVQGEMLCTRPVVNLFDGDGTIECHLGPPDEKQFLRERVHVFFSVDERGDLLHLGLLSDDGWFKGVDGATHQIIREVAEAPAAFPDRAFAEFRRRALACASPNKALLYLSGAERITRAVVELRKQVRQPPSAAAARP